MNYQFISEEKNPRQDLNHSLIIVKSNASEDSFMLDTRFDSFLSFDEDATHSTLE